MSLHPEDFVAIGRAYQLMIEADMARYAYTPAISTITAEGIIFTIGPFASIPVIDAWKLDIAINATYGPQAVATPLGHLYPDGEQHRHLLLTATYSNILVAGGLIGKANYNDGKADTGCLLLSKFCTAEWAERQGWVKDITACLLSKSADVASRVGLLSPLKVMLPSTKIPPTFFDITYLRNIGWEVQGYRSEHHILQPLA